MSRTGEEDDRTGTEAAYWLLALEEEPDNAGLCARFEAWLAASPANRAAWQETTEIHGLIGSPDYAAHRAHRSRREARKAVRAPLTVHSPLGRRVGLALAAMAAAACIALFAPGVVLHLQADHATATAEVRSLTLGDGSTVALAPDSAIEIVPGAGRTVRLLKGEALFKVTRDPARPFRVLAQGVETTVLGTEFDVRLQEDGAVVAVREGVVRVDRATVSERLEAGDWVSVATAGVVDRGTLPVKEIAAWQSGRIIARDRSIDEIVDEIGRSFGGAIVVSQPSFGRRRVTGVYNLDDPETALRAAVSVHGGTVRRLSPWLLIVVGN